MPESSSAGRQETETKQYLWCSMESLETRRCMCSLVHYLSSFSSGFRNVHSDLSPPGPMEACGCGTPQAVENSSRRANTLQWRPPPPPAVCVKGPPSSSFGFIAAAVPQCDRLKCILTPFYAPWFSSSIAEQKKGSFPRDI